MSSNSSTARVSAAFAGRIAIVVSRYHEAITERLAEGATRAFVAAGGKADRLLRGDAPGAFELPVIAAAFARRDDVSAVVCLGLILTGETTHDRHLADAVAHALQDLALETGKPVAFGVLTCQTLAQAEARAGGEKGNKGEEAMLSALAAIEAIRGAHRTTQR
jgi:6,7-dimethyl-8-ribityllumazine synthase